MPRVTATLAGAGFRSIHQLAPDASTAQSIGQDTERRELSGLETIAKLATVLEVEPAELVRMPMRGAKPHG